jgi:hypothetical protein
MLEPIVSPTIFEVRWCQNTAKAIDQLHSGMDILINGAGSRQEEDYTEGPRAGVTRQQSGKMQ